MPTSRIIYDLIGRDNASHAFDRAGASAGRTERMFSRASKAIVVAGAATAAAVVAIGYESAKAAVEFQSSMTKIQTQAGGTRKDVQVLSKDILALGGKVQQGPQQLADSMYHLKSVGLDNAKAMKALRAASDLAAVGGANLEETTNAVAGAWRSGIKGAQSFGQSAATVNAIIGAGNMRMEDFIGAIGTGILPSAKSFGVSMKSVGAALALMTDEGIPADAAATRLRMTLSLIGAPSKVAEKQLNSIGLTGLKLANAMRGPQGIIGAIGLLKTHLDASGLSASRQSQLLSHAFGGGRSSSAILTLINNFEVLRRKQTQINNSIGKFGPAVAAQKKTAEAQLHLLESNLETIGVKLGSVLVGPLAKMAGFLNQTLVPGAIKAGGLVAGAFRHIIPVDAIKADWHDLMRFLGAERPPTPKAGRAYQTAGIARSKRIPMFAASAATPFAYGGAAAAAPAKSMAQSIGDALSQVNWGQVLVKAAGALGKGFGTLLGKIDWAGLGKTAAVDAVPFVIGFINNLGTALIQEAIHHPMDLALFVASIIPIGRLAGIAGTLFGEIPLLGPIVKMFTKPLAAAGAMTEKFFGKILGKIFGKTATRIKGYFGDALGWLRGKGESIILGLWYGAEHIWGKVTAWLGRIFGWVLKPFGKALSWLLGKGGDIVTGLLNGAKSRIGALLGWIGKIYGWIFRIFARTGRWLLTAGGHLITGLLGGIKAKMLGIGSWIKGNVVDPVINAVKSFFGIHSPSTVMHGIGFNLVAGLVRGIIHGDPQAAIGKIFGSMPKALGHLVTKGIVGIGNLGGKALKALGGLGGDILGFLGFGGGGHVPPASGSALAAQRYASSLLSMYGWSQSQMGSLIPLWNQESGWNDNAVNPSSGAYGIPQSLGHGHPYNLGDYKNQVIWGLNYIRQRYITPAAAWAHERAFNWYSKGTGNGGAKPGLAVVGERGPELVNFKGGETVFPAKVTAGLMGYAKGTKDWAKLGRELLRRRHRGILNHEISNTEARKHQENLLASAPGLSGRQHRHYAAMARADKHRLANLKRTHRAEVAYRTQLDNRVAVLKATIAAAKHRGLPGEARRLGRREHRDEQIIRNINLWLDGKPKAKVKPKPKPKTPMPPSGNMDISDWANYLSALSGGTLPAFARGSMYVPATGPAIVHKGEMILPEDVADLIRSGAGAGGAGGAGGGGQFTGNLYLSTGELLGVIDGRIERSDRSHNRRVKSGSGRH